MDLKVLIKCLGRALRSQDIREIDYRANMIRKYMRRHAAWGQ